jgi:hypothetical protein
VYTSEIASKVAEEVASEVKKKLLKLDEVFSQ